MTRIDPQPPLNPRGFSDRAAFYAWFAACFCVSQAVGYTFLYGIESISLFWPSTGVLCATLAMIHRRHWWIILILAAMIDFAAGVLDGPLQDNPQFLVYLFTGLITNPVTALIFALTFRRLVPGGDPLQGPKVLGLYILFPVLLTTAVVSFLSMSLMGTVISGFPILDGWQQWWYSDVMGILAIGTPILVVYARKDQIRYLDDMTLEGTALLLIIGVVTYQFFGVRSIQSNFKYYQVLFMLPLLAWAFSRFGPIMISLITSTISFAVLIGMMYRKLPPHPTGMSVSDHIIAAQGMLLPAILTLLFIASLLESRRTQFFERLELDRNMRNLDRIKTLGVMAGGVAHDFGNLAIAIHAYVSTLRTTITCPDIVTANAIDGLDEIANNAQSLTRSLMIFARDEIHDANTGPKLTDICATVRLCVSILHPIIERKHRLIVRTPTDPIIVAIRPTELQRIVSNIIMNSVDASEPGKTIDIRIQESHSGVQLVIRDEGVGIRREDLPHIFDPFFTTKPRGKGTGLGLAVAAGLVQEVGGEIDVASSPDIGTTITIWFPIVEQRDAPAQAETPDDLPGSIPAIEPC